MGIDVGKVSLPTMRWTLTQAPAPARNVPHAKSGKAQEPLLSDWSGAAHYSVMMAEPGCGTSLACPRFQAAAQSNVELRLAVDYQADSARLYLGSRCLTDSWYS